MSIVNVVRAALAESTDYSRVDIERLEPVAVVGASVSDVSHLLAELLDNALAFSPPSKRVIVTGRCTIDGRYGLADIDAGLGMPDDRLAVANARISAPPVDDFAVSRFLGLYVVGRLADRHEAEVTLTDSPLGGITAHVLLPARLVVAPEPGRGRSGPRHHLHHTHHPRLRGRPPPRRGSGPPRRRRSPPVPGMADRPPADDAWELDAGIVRPYLFTRGRTRPARTAVLP
ncbi:MAG: ATP-binding protein, partial [Acidimicrobiales bacterium]